MNEYIIVERVPTVEEYLLLREAIGIDGLAKDAMEKGLSSSLFSVCVLSKDKVIGLGRVVGDGGIYYYIQDIFVHPDFQGSGIGRQIMNAIMKYFESNLHPKSFIGLMTAEGVTEFYEKFGFKQRPINRPGMFMMWED